MLDAAVYGASSAPSTAICRETHKTRYTQEPSSVCSYSWARPCLWAGHYMVASSLNDDEICLPSTARAVFQGNRIKWALPAFGGEHEAAVCARFTVVETLELFYVVRFISAKSQGFKCIETRMNACVCAFLFTFGGCRRRT